MFVMALAAVLGALAHTTSGNVVPPQPATAASACLASFCRAQQSSCVSAGAGACPAFYACTERCAQSTSHPACNIKCLMSDVPTPDEHVRALLRCENKHCATAEAAGSTEAGGAATPALPRLNPDFNMLPELAEDNYELDGYNRVRYQLRRWRRGPTFGVLENKLLGHTLLDRLELRQQEVLYGAFATKALGEWPKYNRAALLGVVDSSPSHRFVLKSATNGGNADVLVMTEAKWTSGNWTSGRVADYAEQFLHGRWWSEWGQKYEHRGVIMQANALTPGQDGTSKAAPGKLLFEVKVHSVFGRLGMGRLQALPFDGDRYIDVEFGSDVADDAVNAPQVVGAPVRCIGSRGYDDAEKKALCARIEPLLAQQAAKMHSVAAKVRHAYGADWFRFDAFLAETGDLSINEISYPSHIGDFADANGHDTSRDLLGATYKGRGYEVADGSTMLAELFAATGIDAYAFLVDLDFRTMRHADDSVYDASLWPDWTPQKEDARKAAADADAVAASSGPVAVGAFGGASTAKAHRCIGLAVVIAAAAAAMLMLFSSYGCSSRGCLGGAAGGTRRAGRAAYAPLLPLAAATHATLPSTSPHKKKISSVPK